MSPLALQALGIVCGTISTVVVTLYGFKRAGELFERKLEEKLVTKIDVSVYAAKVREVHDTANATNIQLGKAETKIEYLEKEVKDLKAELRKEHLRV